MGNTMICWHLDAVLYLVNPFHSEFMLGRGDQKEPPHKKDPGENPGAFLFMTKIKLFFARHLCSRFSRSPRLRSRSRDRKKRSASCLDRSKNETKTMKIEIEKPMTSS